MDNQNKNLILATALSFLVILVWFVLFPPEEPEPVPEPVQTTTEQPALTGPSADVTGPTADSGDTGSTAQTAAETDDSLARIAIDTPSLSGALSLQGGRMDMLSLKGFRETIDPNSPNVELLTPIGSEHPYFTLFGWAPGGALGFDDVPGPNTQWQIAEGDVLTPETPITLRWSNGNGLTFLRQIAVDEDFMFTVTQSVDNATGAPVRLAPYGSIVQRGEPETMGFFILHEGLVRMSDGELQELSYGKIPDLDPDPRWGPSAEVVEVQESGWVGFTGHYWMTTLIPQPGSPFTSVVRHVADTDAFQTEARLPTMEVAPGERAETTMHVFAGAKAWELIRGYERDMGIERFVDSIDWGWFFFLTKPIFQLLHWLNLAIGNMGWAIILLTLVIKSILFPLAYKSYTSMAKMKELQPEMEKIKERVGGDRQKLQQEMMALYKKEKVNPASGCLPIILQIPIFFSLYKVIFVTLELRHAPWIGWIRDLSAPDPSSILNLFGLLPFSPPDPSSLLAFISLGILPILLGVSMWLQQKLNPAPTDQTQAMIFAWMPWVFMFMLGQFASGLVLYWITNNVITFMQQYGIMRLHGYRPDLFGNIVSSFRRKNKADSK